jgi:hypothetical protein
MDKVESAESNVNALGRIESIENQLETGARVHKGHSRGVKPTASYGGLQSFHH